MAIFSVPWDLRALWSISSHIAKLYLIFLLVVAGYTVVTLIRRGRTKWLPQLHYTCLLLFGACLSNECFGVLRAIDFSRASLTATGIEAFEPILAFSFAVFIILSVLHLLQWSLSSRHS
jgi:hypothetical protein